jgi:putative (di)nucleoside polyphosphate hydrolase
VASCCSITSFLGGALKKAVDMRTILTMKIKRRKSKTTLNTNTMEDDMKISAGLLLTDGKVLLMCHVTNSNPSRFDIPKGCIEKKEAHIDAMKREVLEETGLVISFEDEENLLDLGIFDYLPNKRLHLFLYEQEQLPDINLMKCSSMFTMFDKEWPECDGYKYILFNELKGNTSKALFPVLDKALYYFKHV